MPIFGALADLGVEGVERHDVLPPPNGHSLVARTQMVTSLILALNLRAFWKRNAILIYPLF